MLLHAYILLTARCLVFAGFVPEGGPCSADNNHLDVASHKFISECTDRTFCSRSVNGTCIPRQCRRDEFPFGYDDYPLPPQCDEGSFCPDEGNECKPLVAVGETCQLNRDEQCAPPLDWMDLVTTQNFNGSICLHSICTYANITLGQPCITNNTTYFDFGPEGQRYSNVVIRDNCRSPRLYCDPTKNVCIPTKAVGLPCSSDVECETHECGPNALCAEPPETPFRVAPWQWTVTIVCILGAMIAICSTLFLVHKRHRYQYHRDLREYYLEQLSLRRSIIALHTAAADRYVDGKVDLTRCR